MECVHTYKLERNMVKKIKYMYVNGGRQNSWERKKKREERKCVFWHQNSWMQSKISKYSADAITRFRNVLGLRDSCLIFNHSAIRQQKIRSYVCFKPDAMVSIFQKISHCLLQDCSPGLQYLHSKHWVYPSPVPRNFTWYRWLSTRLQQLHC